MFEITDTKPTITLKNLIQANNCMTNFKFAIFLFVFVALCSAIPMLEPYQQEISNGDEIYLGELGPGQTISISLDGRLKTGGIHGLGGAYENASVDNLPKGWSARDSDWAGIPLNVKITSNKQAPAGEYKMRIRVFDEGDKEKLGNITFFVKINITHDVLDVSLDDDSKEVFSEQPVKFKITITNKANTGDSFTITSTNIPKWMFKESIYVPAKSSKSVFYEIASTEEERYSPIILVVSDSSSIINKTLNASVSVNPTLSSDFKAINNGMLFFPAMSGIIYALAGLFSNFI